MVDKYYYTQTNSLLNDEIVFNYTYVK